MRAKSVGFEPKKGQRYKCTFCDKKTTRAMFCYGCRYFVCSRCEAYDSIASLGGKHTVETHRQCAGCTRIVHSGRIGSWRWIEPDCDTKYRDPEDML